MYFIKPQIKIESFETEFINLPSVPILVLTSKEIAESNGIDKIILKQQKITGNILYIDDVKPENPFTYIESVYNRLKFRPSIIVGIGGGTVLDLAKAMSVATSYNELISIFYGSRKITNKYSTVICFPTTFGTGAEVSYGAILYDDHNEIKNGIRGELVQSDKVILDFSLYKSAPERIKALSGFDCLTHCIETYVSKLSDDITRYQSVASLNVIFDNLKKAVNNDEEAIKKMAIASLMMGLNLAFSSTCMPHRLQYVIGPLTHTSHAEGLAALYKGWLELILKHNSGIFFNLASDLHLTGHELVNKIKDLKNELKISFSLSDFGLSGNDIDIILKNVSGKLDADPYYEDDNSIRDFIKLSL